MPLPLSNLRMFLSPSTRALSLLSTAALAAFACVAPLSAAA